MIEAQGGPVNLALDISEPDSTAGSGSQQRAARVYVQLACSYLSGQGAPTLTRDCTSFAELEAEVTRLKGECDAILAEAKTRLEGGSEAASPAPSQQPEPRTTAKKTLSVANELTVADRMTPDVRVMRRNDKLSVANELMKVGGFRHVLVLEDDEDRLAGVVSHRDIFYSALAWATGQGERAHEQSLDQLAAKEVMSTNPASISPDTPLREAARIMLEGKIGCLPVLQEDRVVGILTEGDFLSLVTNASVDETNA